MSSFALPLTIGSRQPDTGAARQPGAQTPPTGASPVGQLVHSLALGPEHVVHEASHAPQVLSLVAEQDVIVYWSGPHSAAQVEQLACPAPAKVPVAHGVQGSWPLGPEKPGAQSGLARQASWTPSWRWNPGTHEVHCEFSPVLHVTSELQWGMAVQVGHVLALPALFIR
jgi:hypothetical protein